MRIPTPLAELDAEVVGDGPPAVLWHSLCVDREAWSRIRDTLAAQRRLILLDGPGHGRSGAPGRRFTLDETADAALTVLDVLGIGEPVDWVGNAWGGHVGIVLAARDPQRLRTLTTIATLVPAVSGRLRLQVRALLAAHRAFGPSAFVVDQMLPTYLSRATRRNDPEAVAYVRDRIAAMTKPAFATTMASVMIDREDLTPHLARLRTPTLFITGAEDPIWTPADVRAAESDRIAAAVIDDSAHLCALEAPATTADAILEGVRESV